MADYQLKMAHLYGNLLNTYGDNGNILMLGYIAQNSGVRLTTEIVSIHEPFDPKRYDLVFFLVAVKTLNSISFQKIFKQKKESLTEYIENDGVMLAICGGYQLLGHYYTGAHGEKIQGISALDHYTLSQDNNRFIGDIKIYNDEFDESYVGFENHNGYTVLGKKMKNRWAELLKVMEITEKIKLKALITAMFFLLLFPWSNSGKKRDISQAFN